MVQIWVEIVAPERKESVVLRLRRFILFICTPQRTPVIIRKDFHESVWKSCYRGQTTIFPKFLSF
jgi:hypothetical protein